MVGRQYIQSASRVVLYCYAYVFLDWLFLATKPSFLGAWPFLDRLNALLVGIIPFLIASLVLHAVLCSITFAASRSRTLSRRTYLLLSVTPALIAAAIVLVLVDNFTYTVFGWGIVDTMVYTAPIYWLLSLLIFIFHIRRRPYPRRYKPAVAMALVLVSGIALLLSLYTGNSYNIGTAYHSAWTGKQLPNIIMFASDGVTADHMSAYGYHRKTTPNLDQYLDQALIADNAFTNSGWTTGSITSMMTGKYPATTKLLYPPYTLKGADAYQTLPRILHKLGYKNLQETVRYYADGPDLNWADSFDYANGRKIRHSPIDDSLALQSPLLFADRVYDRLSDRVGQLLFIKPMVNSYAAVTSEQDIAKVKGIPDETRMNHVFDFIRKAHRPFFIHIHLLGTHCCHFHLSQDEKHFSARKFDDEEQGESAVYDDTILRSDRYFGEMMAVLKQQHLLNNTLIVYTSDHDKGWDFRSPVPLIFLFPGGEHKGHIAETAQLLDVAPTILEYLKVNVPGWMEGSSLLHKQDPARPVFAIFSLDREHFNTDKGDRLSRVVDMGPPTYGLRKLGMVVCHRWYMLRLKSHKVTTGAVGTFYNKYQAAPGAPIGPSACTKSGLPTKNEAFDMMSRLLKQRGFSF